MPQFGIFIVLSQVVFLVISLYRSYFSPIVSFFIVIVVFSTTGILTPQEVLLGFANEQIAVIIMLLILGNLVQKTSVMNWLFDFIFREAKSLNGFMARLFFYVAGSSAFLNNTPLVAMTMPYVQNWSKKRGVAPSKLLIPLSYAAILGGGVTLIGTSTNLLVNGMAIESGINSLSIFDFAWVGLPMVFLGFLYLRFVGMRLLPSNQDVLISLSENSRKYLVEASVKTNSNLIDKTVEQANLRNLKDLFLVEIIRGDFKIAPVAPNRMLRANDRLIFAGETKQIINLLDFNTGLELPLETKKHLSEQKTDIVEVVVAQNSTLVNQKIRNFNFRAKYDAAIIAVHRNGAKLKGKIGEIVLQAGDVLLLMTGKSFLGRPENTNDFYLISKIRQKKELSKAKLGLLIGGIFIAILMSGLGFVSLFKALLILLASILVFKVASLEEVKTSVDYNLLAIAGMALGVGKAMENTGAADLIAQSLFSIFQGFNVFTLLMLIFLITNLLSSYLTNKAAVSIIFPISISIGNFLLETGSIATIKPFVLVVAMAGAASFITPIGYQTNLMVYGSGSYSFKDFLKIGAPLTVIYMVVSAAILSYLSQI